MANDQDCTMVDDTECKSSEQGSSQLVIEKADRTSLSIMGLQVILDEVGTPVTKDQKISFG